MQLKKRKPLKKSVRKAIWGYLFVSIWIVGFLLFTFYPFIMSIIFSFSKVKFGGAGMELIFVGINNFRNIFTLEEGFNFLEAIRDFAMQLLIQVPIILVFSILIAMLLNRKMKARGFFRMIFFLPVIIASGPVINELISQGAAGTSFIEEYGVITLLNEKLPEWLASPLSSIFEEIIIVFWFSGVQIIIFLAGLQKIDSSVYEASSIDGAGPWESFWKITLPALKSLILVNGIYTIITLATFSENGVIKVINRAMNSTLENSGYGFASALAWIYLLVVLLALGIVLFLLRNKEPKKVKVVKKSGKYIKVSR